jgi:outer membrane protein OmpA-like peptidoglycan-associated protein
MARRPFYHSSYGRRSYRAAAQRPAYGAGVRGRPRGRLCRPRATVYGAARPNRGWPRGALAGGLAVAVVLALAGFMVVRARAAACDTTGDRIIWAQQETQEEGGITSPPSDLLSRADQLAACDEGQLVMLVSAGQGAVQAGPAVSLIVYREPGEVENDPTARQHGVQTIVDTAFARARTVRPPGSGRDIIGLMAAIAAERGQGITDVWLQTLGLPTINPADARELMAADPDQAVASIAKWVPALPGMRFHLALSPPAGDQPLFNTATDAWRRQFMLALLRQAGADVISVTEVESVESAAPGAPAAPVVPNLPESTPRLPQPRPSQPYTAKLDSSALFVPNTAQFLTSEREVLKQLQPIITGWKQGLFSRVTVVGHCARYGPPQGAVQLSEHRAAEVAGLLRQAGVTVITAWGVGYDQPLPPNPQSATNRVVIVTAYPKTQPAEA